MIADSPRQVRGGALALVVLCILSILPPQATAQPITLTDLTLLPGDTAPGPAAADQTSPAIARGGDLYLAVWQDTRGDSPDIFAAVLGADGTPLDTLPMAISQAPGMQSKPRVAWNGANWLVTWQSQMPTQFYYAAGVLGVRVSPQGDILDAAPITIMAYQNSSDLVYALASDGTNWAAVVEGTSGGEAAVRGVRIAPDGTVLDPGGVVVIPEASFIRFGLELGGVPGEYLLAWSEWRSASSDDILAYRLTPTLQRIETTAFVIAARSVYETNPKIATDGASFFVAWNLNDNYLLSDVFGSRVSFAGQVMDPNGKRFSNAGPGNGRNPCVAWDGVNWVAAWPNYIGGGLNAGMMSPAGVILNPGGVSMPDLGWGAIAGAAAGGFTAVWSDNNEGSFDVWGASVSGSLVAGPRVCASLAAPEQTALALAYNGDGYLAVFLSTRSSGSRVLGQRLDSFGDAIDAEPFEIAGPAGTRLSPSVAWNGSLYLVTWSDLTQVWARRVGADGSLIDAEPIAVMPGQSWSCVAASGDLFLVVSHFAPGYPEFVFVHGTRIRGTDGVKLDAAPFAISGTYAHSARVAGVGGRWIVAWELHPSHDDPHAVVSASFVDQDALVSAAFTAGSSGMYNLAPGVGANGDTALVAWGDSRDGFNNLQIYAKRVLANGTVLDGGGIAVSQAINTQSRPAVATDGEEFAVLYHDQRNIPTFFDEHLDVYGTRVTTAGSVLDADGFAFANDPVASEILAAGAGGNGTAQLGCSVFRADAPYTAFRIGLRRWNAPPITSVDSENLGGARITLAVSTTTPRTDIALRITSAARADVRVDVFDLRGRLVARPFHGVVPEGSTDIAWDASDSAGRRVAAGVYLVRLRSDDVVVDQRIIVR